MWTEARRDVVSHKIIWNTKVRYDLLRITMDSGDVVGTEPLELICIHQKTKCTSNCQLPIINHDLT